MTRGWRIAPDIQTEFATRGPDAAIAALAERQHGVVSLPQLTEFGFASVLRADALDTACDRAEQLRLSEAKLIVETDSHETHRTGKAFEADRRRDQLLAEAGYTTLRFTWRQLTTEPERIARTIATVFERAGSHTSLRGNSALERRSRRRTIPA